MEANIDGTLKTMRTDIDKTLQQIRVEAAERGHTQTKWIIGVGLGLAALMLAFWGLPLLTAGS